MATQLTIRHVPTSVRDELASRAAAERKSMQEYLLGELERLARRPTPTNWVEQVRAHKAAAPSRIGSREILRHRDADRR